MDDSVEPGYFLQKVYKSVTKDLQMQAINTAEAANEATTYVNPQNIDRLVEMEMKCIKENCLRKEQQYVEQMLLENPITIERRPNNNHQQQQQPSSEDDVVDVVTVTINTEEDKNNFLQLQRAEACRRSRYNNKIRKAKSNYRHKYMSQKLLQSTQMFNCIQDLIAQAENHLLTQGLTKDKLQHLRRSFGMEKAIENVAKLDHIMKMEN